MAALWEASGNSLGSPDTAAALSLARPSVSPAMRQVAPASFKDASAVAAASSKQARMAPPLQASGSYMRFWDQRSLCSEDFAKARSLEEFYAPPPSARRAGATPSSSKTLPVADGPAPVTTEALLKMSRSVVSSPSSTSAASEKNLGWRAPTATLPSRPKTQPTQGSKTTGSDGDGGAERERQGAIDGRNLTTTPQALGAALAAAVEATVALGRTKASGEGWGDVTHDDEPEETTTGVAMSGGNSTISSTKAPSEHSTTEAPPPSSSGDNGSWLRVHDRRPSARAAAVARAAAAARAGTEAAALAEAPKAPRPRRKPAAARPPLPDPALVLPASSADAGTARKNCAPSPARI